MIVNRTIEKRWLRRDGLRVRMEDMSSVRKETWGKHDEVRGRQSWSKDENQLE